MLIFAPWIQTPAFAETPFSLSIECNTPKHSHIQVPFYYYKFTTSFRKYAAAKREVSELPGLYFTRCESGASGKPRHM